MLIPTLTTQFKRDCKLAEKRGRDMSRLRKVMTVLGLEQPLDPKFRDHKLVGTYQNHRECHIEPDWLLIYKITPETITFVRTGSHSDLFKM